jgi:hypothetical protein
MERNELSMLVKETMEDGTVACYSEAFDLHEDAITKMAKKIGQPTGYVMACIVDDIEAGICEKDEQDAMPACDPYF